MKRTIFLILFIISTISLSAQEDKTYQSIEEALINPNLVFSLELSGEEIIEIPRTKKKLKNLKYLTISNTLVTELPKEIGSLSNLVDLDLRMNQIKTLPKSNPLKMSSWENCC